ncbi:autotransporter outer membrane beta-barrel domain-containing protein [Brucella sp. 21LCYQ03]|nr:autotransporter outer membrane beta-barrel domain-containing protein [Brucella sp. 21LCYQ03]
MGDGTTAGAQMKAVIDSNLTGSHGLNKMDNGTLILTADNTYTGDTTISGGALQLGNGGATGSVTGKIVNNGSLILDRSDPVTVSNSITGTGNVIKRGDNTLTLSGANNFTGGLEVDAGTVVAGRVNAFGRGTLTVNQGATVDLGGYTQQQITGLAGAGTIHTSTETLTLTQAGDSIFSGQFDHAAGDTKTALIKQGDGTLALTGDNSGDVELTGGALWIGNGGTTGSLKGNIASNAQVAFNRSDITTYDGVISGSGVVNQMGSGTTIFTGENTYTGGTTIRQGTLQIGNGGTTGSIKGDVANNGTLAFDRSDDTSFAGVISGHGSVEQKGTGSLTLAGANTFTGGLNVTQGIVKAGVADTAFGSANLNVGKSGKADLNGFNTTVGGINGEGSVALTGANLTLKSGGSFDGSLSGTGGLTLDGAHQILAGSADYTGATTLKSSTLALGASNAFSAASNYSIDGSSTLDMAGFSATVGSINNAGNIGNSGHAGSVLHVAGSYASTGGGITINTALGGDNSKTDMLKVDGDVSGKTMLTVHNDGGFGEKTVNGIKVVDVAGKTTGGFSLAGDYYTKDGQSAVVAGAYAYTLRRNSPIAPNDGNWYLTNVVYNHGDTPVDPNNPNNPTPRYSAGVPVYEGYAQNMQALNKLPTLQQRVGNRYWTGENGDGKDKGAVVNSYGVWARVEGAHNRFEPNTTTARMKQDINTYMMQAGIDGQFYEDENGKLIAGFNGQYGHAKGDISSFSGDGSISTDAWSLGATATWYGNNGFYVDTQGQISWFDNDLESSTANIGLANGRKAMGYGLSVEAGQRIDIDQNWSLTPQAQLAWSSIDADDFNDVWNSRVSLHDGNSLLGRIGLAANYRNDWKGEDGLGVNTTVYGIANLYQEMLRGSSVTVSGVSFDTDSDRTWGGVGFGGTYAWADSKFTIYGEGSINTSLNNFANSYSYKATTGFKVKW